MLLLVVLSQILVQRRETLAEQSLERRVAGMSGEGEKMLRCLLRHLAVVRLGARASTGRHLGGLPATGCRLGAGSHRDAGRQALVAVGGLEDRFEGVQTV